MCEGPGIEKAEDVKVKIALGVRRYWDSEEGRAEKRARQQFAREARIARDRALLNLESDAKPF